MRKRLKIALMTAAIATFLSLTPSLSAASSATIMAATDDSGHKVYVNDIVAPSSRRGSKRELSSATVSAPTFRSQQNRLVFWSTTEHQWKTVPHANVRAARSAAAEVDQFLDKPQSEQNSPLRKGFTQKEIDDAISKAADRHAVDPNLVRALVKVESNFNPNAVSRKGAMGLMQLMPQTARQLRLTNPFNPEENIDAGVRHLKDLLDSYGGDVNLDTSYSIFTQATIDFAGAGMAGFTLQGAVTPGSTGTPLVAETPTSAPEPISILLLGSGLVGLGVLRRKHGRTI